MMERLLKILSSEDGDRIVSAPKSGTAINEDPRSGDNPVSVFQRSESGQVLVIGLFVAIGLSMVALSVANVGIMVAEKIHVQDTVDAAAYSAAVTQARYMNLSAYINRAMVANYDTMAFNWALWATVDAVDHGLAVIVATLYELSVVLFAFVITAAFAGPVSGIADAINAAHSLAHTFNHELNEVLAQEEDNSFNELIEQYNVDVLTLLQGFLYAAAQTARYDVVREVAKNMDSEVRVDSVLELGAETVNYDELARAVDYVVRDTDARTDTFGNVVSQFNRAFNDMTGSANDSNNDVYLAAVTEASLNPFSAGRRRDGTKDALRRAGVPDVFGWVSDAIELALDIECEIVTLSFGDCDSDVSMDIGSFPRTGQENKASESHVPFIARKRLREVNQFGFHMDVSGVPDFTPSSVLSGLAGNHGHTSSDTWGDVANCANAMYSFEKDLGRLTEAMQTGCQLGTPISMGGLNSMNVLQSILMLPSGSLMTPPVAEDDHWDGTYDGVEPVDSWKLPVFGGGAGLLTTVEYQANVVGDGGTEEGVPRYDWIVDIDNVGFPNYHYPMNGAQSRAVHTSAGGNENLLTGPSVAVIGVKDADKINGLKGLGIGNGYSITAIARAQVYYVRSVNRPNERPSLFNPYWVARLAPLDSEDAPPLVREGLPYLTSFGIPIKPTH